MNTDSVLGYSRPAMLGGPTNTDPDALTVRWYGTSNYELNFHDRVVLLDTFYDRGPRMRGLGFRPDEVERADAILIGHPHYDHISDAAQVADRTGASVVVHPLGADVLTRDGIGTDQIIDVTGRGEGEVLEFADFTVRVIHGLHAELGHPEQSVSLQALIEARKVWESDEPPLSPEEEAYTKAVQQRGSWEPEVMTEGTMCLIIDVDGYRIVYRDSAGPVERGGAELFREQSWLRSRHSRLRRSSSGPSPAQRSHDASRRPLPTQIILPCHHDDLFPVFIDMPTEPLKMRVHEHLPAASTVQPVYVEPVTIGMKSGLVTVGDP